MRAVHIERLDGPAAVRVVDIAEPEPGEGQVLIDVHAAGVTFPEVLQSRGKYQIQPELPFVPGSEVAGTVRSAPEGSGFQPGQRVAAFPGFGGFAETVAVDRRAVFRLPERMSFETAAAIPMNVLTSHFALVHRGRLQPGEIVLVHGAAGGIGTASIQLAKVLGARVIAVVSTDAKAQVARDAGADDVVRVDGFKDAVQELTGGVDIVVDPVGGDRFTDSLRCLRPDGRLLVIGFTAGEIPTVKVNRLLFNNIAVVGVGWGPYWRPQPEFMQRQWDDLWPHISSGVLDPLIGARFPLSEVGKALQTLEDRAALGKVVLQVR
ncbi:MULTISPECIES: NADPH:quinone oxidoreductase family protein [Thermocrispum]|uniref:NADPH:quinone oxidoreductase family protein n=1 Tax=Thermocrispum agreste TaxID=37925 RepID=A0A2W4JKK6_9PSEU|nr:MULTISPECIES: NADPH:quinone oxidoreductase family protein [Thermocrispum]PZM98708.1 MAG: NADPH:quinone oxidoreductase family protein [Thermocrispum agreste]